LNSFADDEGFRRKLLIAVAFGADFGGMATPVGTGPNAIAIASIAQSHGVSFFSWMIFAFPLTLGMLLLSFALLTLRRPTSSSSIGTLVDGPASGREMVSLKSKQKVFLLILLSTVVLWLSEPIHQVPSPVIALGAAAALFITRVLTKDDLPRIGWSTLLLISGGITLGRLLEQLWIMKDSAGAIPFADLNPVLGLFLICLASATLSALMSNTATVILLIPIAAAIDPAPSTTVLVAISASFGIPFIISTPPNSMAFSQGGLRFGDLFWPGILMMVIGCAVVSLTGKLVLNLAGIP
jgi:solute carrier family 13 (sodium-dependent dicarboxylate transporter), member 2/3/5